MSEYPDWLTRMHQRKVAWMKVHEAGFDGVALSDIDRDAVEDMVVTYRAHIVGDRVYAGRPRRNLYGD